MPPRARPTAGNYRRHLDHMAPLPIVISSCFMQARLTRTTPRSDLLMKTSNGNIGSFDSARKEMFTPDAKLMRVSRRTGTQVLLFASWEKRDACFVLRRVACFLAFIPSLTPPGSGACRKKSFGRIYAASTRELVLDECRLW